MNRELRLKLGVEVEEVPGLQLEDLLTVGSKIFYQTHFYPLVKMQNNVREIYLVFKGVNGQIPALLNVEVKKSNDQVEILCGGMEISKRNKYEKELLAAKKQAENALLHNAELREAKNKLLKNQSLLEFQLREVNLLKEQQQEIFRLIAHDLQEPLRKTIFMSNYILNTTTELSSGTEERVRKIINYNIKMREMLLMLLRFKELEGRNLEYTSINLSDLVSSAVKSLMIDNKDSIILTCPNTCISLKGDYKLLKNLFVALIRNSQNEQHANKDRLLININAFVTVKNNNFQIKDHYQYKKFVKITYTDNSKGYSSKLNKIIQKSEDLNKVNIGLAYSAQVVDKHNGAMEAASLNGKGVNYTIFLPIDPDLKN
ncbi:HAMP domain-containing histidine kinase [Winogradskyella ursingii]|uniref:HAMP domain-containing histidine kinase n=1 Tax=Winogradskyella ursingii TaxID=2686079 RepID=UPI0015C8F1CB|nr:HAMP domain-containing histidine kinase [Winogradskyella ursingii]